MAKSKHKKDTNSGRSKKVLNTAIIVAIISTLGTISVPLLPSLFQFITTAKPTPVLPTETPIPYAQIESLNVAQGGAIMDTVYPGETIFLDAETSVVIKANVIANTSLDDLVFHWEFCHQENNTRGQGAVEVPYLLNAESTDCISIRIEKGGQYLDTANFFVNQNKNQP